MSKFTHAYLGQGSGPIFLTRLRCSGEEEWLGQCNGTEWEVDDCFHGEDAGIFCYDGVSYIGRSGGAGEECVLAGAKDTCTLVGAGGVDY